MAELHASLDRRYRPEDVAGLVLQALAERLTRRERVVLERAASVGRSIRWTPARGEFLADRQAREAAGMELSKRRYNRRFRMLGRLSAKAGTPAVEQDKRSDAWQGLKRVAYHFGAAERSGDKQPQRALQWHRPWTTPM